MPDYTIAVDPRAQLAIITWTAPQPTIELCRAVLASLDARPDFRPHFGIVSDWRAVRTAPGSMFVQQFLTALETYHATGHFTGRWATVVPPAAAVYGMARMAELLSEQSLVPYHAFQDFDEACRWARPATEQ